MRIPTDLLNAIKGLYEGDTYELIEEEKHTGPIKSFRGVRQGCPLSPLLFALFVNDIAAEFPPEYGAKAGEKDTVITHSMYADDLVCVYGLQES